MTRLTRFVLVFALTFGFSAGSTTQSEAGVIPWAYDAIFGPVGSLRGQGTYAGYGTGYTPYSAGYGSYGMGYGTSYSSYAPVSVAYLPPNSASSCGCGQTSANYGSTAGYGYSSYGYAPAYNAASGCNSCASGNCSTGNSVITNSAPNMGGTISPIPDSQTLRNELSRLKYLEEKVYDLEHQQIQDEKVLKEHFPDFHRTPYVPRTRNNYDQGENVPAREKRSTFTSGSNPDGVDRTRDTDFPQPRRQKRRDDEISNETQKVTIDPPKDDSSESKAKTSATENGNSKSSTEKVNAAGETSEEKDSKTNLDGEKPANEVKEKEPITMRLENMVTTRPVVPRNRFLMENNRVPTNIAKSQRRPIKTLDTSREADFVRR